MQKSIDILARDFVNLKAFDWIPRRSSKCFELYRGDEVRQRKKDGERFVKQSKGVATDFHIYGFARLSGTESLSFKNWLARRARDAGKGRDAEVLSLDGVDDVEAPPTTITYDAETVMDEFISLIDDEF